MMHLHVREAEHNPTAVNVGVVISHRHQLDVCLHDTPYSSRRNAAAATASNVASKKCGFKLKRVSNQKFQVKSDV
jgi:hypothetical protein